MSTLYYILFVIIFALTDIKSTYAQWWTSTENFGDRVVCLAICGNNVLAGGYTSLLLSTDNGTNWTRITSGFPKDYSPDVLAVNNDTAFMVIQTLNSYSSIYRSTDNGFNWTKLDFNFDDWVTSFAFIGKYIFAGAWSGGIYISPDNGESWTYNSEGFLRDSSGNLMSTITLAAQGSILFAGVGDLGQKGGLFLSADSGKSWNPTGLINLSVRNLAVVKDEKGNSNTIALTRSYNDNGDIANIFLSKDKAATWTKIDSGVTDKFPSALATIPDESGGTDIFAGTGYDGVYLSTDYGKSWKSAGLPYNYIWSLAAGLGEDGIPRLFAGNLGPGHIHGAGSSVFFSGDKGVHWSGSASNTYINALALSSTGNGGSNMFAVASNVFMSSTNNGMTWEVTGLPSPNFTSLAVSPKSGELDGTNTFYGAGKDGVFHSTDNGESWTHAASPGGEFSVVSFLTMYPNFEGEIVLFAGTTEGAFTSTDNGTSWIPKPGLSGKYIEITSYIISNQNEFAGTRQEGVFLSTHNDTNWQAINTGLTNLNINTFAVCNEILFAGTDGGVFRYMENDTSWSAAGLQDKYVETFAVKDSCIFAGTSGEGVFLSNDYGITWKPVNTGLANLIINGFVINDGDLIAGTGGGIWRRPLSDMITSVEKRNKPIPVRFELSQNYPNPFNPTTIISYSIPNDGKVILKVYDILGREVATLVNEEKPAGTFRVNFNGESLSSGIYFYSLRTNGKIFSKKMLLLK